MADESLINQNPEKVIEEIVKEELCLKDSDGIDYG